MDRDDIVEINQLMALYGHAVDADDQSLLSEVFTRDAVYEAPFERLDGLDEICAWFARGKPPHPPSHHTSNVWARQVGEEVLVRSKWLVPDRNTGGVCTGDYDDILVRTSDGWRISRRVCVFRYPTMEQYASTRRAEDRSSAPAAMESSVPSTVGADPGGQAA